MGYELQRWALTEQHPCLTPRTRLVLAAICMVSHDDHGEFWMRGKRLISEHLPDMSYSSYKNHLGILVRNELLTKLEHGGGRTSGGRGTSNRYRVNAPSVTPQQPPQGVLPEIVRSPAASPPEPEVTDTPMTVDASAAHRKLDEMLLCGHHACTGRRNPGIHRGNTFGIIREHGSRRRNWTGQRRNPTGREEKP